MPEKVMQKVRKMMPKCIQNVSQKRTKNWKYRKKRMQEIDAEIWCQKDAGSKEFEKFLDQFGSISVAYGNIPAPGREKTGTKNKVPGIVLKDFVIGISVSIFWKIWIYI